MSPSRVTLGEIADFINGVAFKPADWEESGKRIIRIQNLTDPKKPFNRTNRAVAKKYEVAPGDLLVSWSATLGVFVWEGPDTGLVNQHIFRVVPHHGRVDPRYLRHMLSDALVQMEEHLHGATMKHVNRGQFLGTKIPLPSLVEQKRIAGILDGADALGAKRRDAIAQLDTLLQSTFLDMFGDPVINPMGWERPLLEDVCEQVIDCPHSTPRWSRSGVICLRTSNLGKGDWDWADTRFVTEEDYTERTRRSEILPNDIILSREGTVGVLALVDEGMRLCMGQRLVQLRVNDSQLDPRFL